MKINILGINIDKISQTDAIEQVEQWINTRDKHYIVTPNPEFILAAQKDPEFKRILNNADLAIPDSSSLGFSDWFLKRNILLRFLLWPLFFLPVKLVIPFERVSGTDLMEALCQVSAEKGFTTGFLGGKGEVAKKTADCMLERYPNLKISYIFSGGIIDRNGNLQQTLTTSYPLRPPKVRLRQSFSEASQLPATDLLFVAFGHIKQEKWIANNLDKIPVRVAMGVGGAFDYLSGSVPRAPKWIQDLGFEWLYRLIVQPWRIKRQLGLLQYLWLLIKG